MCLLRSTLTHTYKICRPGLSPSRRSDVVRTVYFPTLNSQPKSERQVLAMRCSHFYQPIETQNSVCEPTTIHRMRSKWCRCVGDIDTLGEQLLTFRSPRLRSERLTVSSAASWQYRCGRLGSVRRFAPTWLGGGQRGFRHSHLCTERPASERVEAGNDKCTQGWCPFNLTPHGH